MAAIPVNARMVSADVVAVRMGVPIWMSVRQSITLVPFTLFVITIMVYMIVNVLLGS